MSISERIVYIQEQEGISASKFADLIGIQRSGLSHIYSGRNKPSIDFLQKLSIQFPQYRLDWIINGNEPILKGQIKANSEHNRDLFNQQPNDMVKSENEALYRTEKIQKEAVTIPKSIELKNETISSKELKEIIYIYSDNTFEVLKPLNNK
jgi:transcriptional regulator with XRE-family HTH domain